MTLIAMFLFGFVLGGMFIYCTADVPLLPAEEER